MSITHQTQSPKLKLKDFYPSTETIRKYQLTKNEQKDYSYLALSSFLITHTDNSKTPNPLNYDYLFSDDIINMRKYLKCKKMFNELDGEVAKTYLLNRRAISKAKTYLGIKHQPIIAETEVKILEDKIVTAEKEAKYYKEMLSYHDENKYKTEEDNYTFKIACMAKRFQEFLFTSTNNDDKLFEAINVIDIFQELLNNCRSILEEHRKCLDLQESLSEENENIIKLKKQMSDLKKNNIVIEGA